MSKTKYWNRSDMIEVLALHPSVPNISPDAASGTSSAGTGTPQAIRFAPHEPHNIAMLSLVRQALWNSLNLDTDCG